MKTMSSMFARPVSWLLVSLVLPGCAGFGVHDGTILEEWPETVPDQALFIEAWQRDHENRHLQSDIEYLNWVVRFYEGGELMSMGWNDMTPAILQGLAPEQARRAARQRDRLGRLIAAEWAKDNDVREIDTAMLSLWGDLMVAAPEPSQRLAAMDMIARDVEQLLSGRLSPALITEQRYVDALGIQLD
jgi:hypothetical protein